MKQVVSATPNPNAPFDQGPSVSHDRDYANRNEIKRIENTSDRGISTEFDKLNESLYKINNFLRLSKEIDDLKKENLVKNDIQRKLSLKSQWLNSNHSSTVSLNNLPPAASRRNSSGNISVQSYNKVEPKTENDLQRQRRNFAEFKSRSFQNVNAPSEPAKRRFGRYTRFNSFEELDFMDRVRLSDDEVSRLSQEPDFQDIKMKIGESGGLPAKSADSKLTTRSNSKDSFSVSSSQRDLSKYFPKKEVKAKPCNVNRNQKELKDVDLTKYFQPSPVQEMKSLPSPGQSPHLPRKPLKAHSEDHANSTNTLLRTAIDNLQKFSKQKSVEEPPANDVMRKENFTMHDQQMDGAVSIRKMSAGGSVQKPVSGYESISLVDDPETDDDDCDKLFAGLKSPTENIDELFDKVAADVCPTLAKGGKKVVKTGKKPLSKKVGPTKIAKSKNTTPNAKNITTSAIKAKVAVAAEKPARKDISEYFAPMQSAAPKASASNGPVDWHKKDGFLDMNRESEILGKLSSNLLNEIKLLEQHLELNQGAAEQKTPATKKPAAARAKVTKEVAKKSNRQTTKELDSAINDILNATENEKIGEHLMDDDVFMDAIEEMPKDEDVVDAGRTPFMVVDVNAAAKTLNGPSVAVNGSSAALNALQKPDRLNVVNRNSVPGPSQSVEQKPKRLGSKIEKSIAQHVKLPVENKPIQKLPIEIRQKCVIQHKPKEPVEKEVKFPIGSKQKPAIDSGQTLHAKADNGKKQSADDGRKPAIENARKVSVGSSPKIAVDHGLKMSIQNGQMAQVEEKLKASIANARKLSMDIGSKLPANNRPQSPVGIVRKLPVQEAPKVPTQENGSVADKKAIAKVLSYKTEMPAISVPMKAAIITLPKSYRGIKSTDLKPKPKPTESVLTPSNVDHANDLKWTHSKPAAFEVHSKPINIEPLSRPVTFEAYPKLAALEAQLKPATLEAHPKPSTLEAPSKLASSEPKPKPANLGTLPKANHFESAPKPIGLVDRRPSVSEKYSKETASNSSPIDAVKSGKIHPKVEERRSSFEFPKVPMQTYAKNLAEASKSLIENEKKPQNMTNGCKFTDHSKQGHFDSRHTEIRAENAAPAKSNGQKVHLDRSNELRHKPSNNTGNGQPKSRPNSLTQPVPNGHGRQAVETQSNSFDAQVPIKPMRKQRAQDPSPSRVGQENGAPSVEPTMRTLSADSSAMAEKNIRKMLADSSAVAEKNVQKLSADESKMINQQSGCKAQPDINIIPATPQPRGSTAPVFSHAHGSLSSLTAQPRGNITSIASQPEAPKQSNAAVRPISQSKPIDIAPPAPSHQPDQNGAPEKRAHRTTDRPDEALSYNSSGSGDYDNVPSLESKRSAFKGKGQSKSFDVPSITERRRDDDDGDDAAEAPPETSLRRRLSFDRKRNVSDMLIERSKMLHNRKQEFMNEKLVETKNPYIRRMIEKESRGTRSAYDRPLMSCLPSSNRYDYQPYTPTVVSRTLPSASVSGRLSSPTRQSRFSPVRMSPSPSRLSPVRSPPSSSSNRSVLDMFRHPSANKDSCIIS